MAREMISLDGDGELVLRSGKSVKSLPSIASSMMAKPHMGYLLIDSSSSMEGVALVEAKQGAIQFAKEGIAKGYHLGLIEFDSESRCLCHPTRDIEVLVRHISLLAANGSTDMTGAIRLGTHFMPHKNCVRSIVVVTDGVPNDVPSALHAAKEAKASGIDIIAIGTGAADHTFLAQLATSSDLATYVEVADLSRAMTSAAKMLPQE